jgi:hypothetical protein
MEQKKAHPLVYNPDEQNSDSDDEISITKPSTPFKISIDQEEEEQPAIVSIMARPQGNTLPGPSKQDQSEEDYDFITINSQDTSPEVAPSSFPDVRPSILRSPGEKRRTIKAVHIPLNPESSVHIISPVEIQSEELMIHEQWSTAKLQALKDKNLKEKCDPNITKDDWKKDDEDDDSTQSLSLSPDEPTSLAELTQKDPLQPPAVRVRAIPRPSFLPVNPRSRPIRRSHSFSSVGERSNSPTTIAKLVMDKMDTKRMPWRSPTSTQRQYSATPMRTAPAPVPRTPTPTKTEIETNTWRLLGCSII